MKRTALVIAFLLIAGTAGAGMLHPTLNMENTVSPIISDIAEKACGYNNVQHSTPAKGGALIYKRQKIDSCTSGIGNVYYIRCYDWEWDRNDRLWKRPTKDVKLGSYSCIDESDVDIPYHDKQLQRAKIGQKYYATK